MSRMKLTRTAKISGNERDNTLRRAARVQPQMAQSVSNLQHDTIEASKDMIKKAFNSQRQIASGIDVSVPTQVSEQIAKQSHEMTNNFERATGIYNQLGTSVLDAEIENTNIYNKTFAAFVEYNNNMLNAWTSFWIAQQQQFIRA
jgi:hypothetical protein